MTCTAKYYNEGQCMEQHGKACIRNKCDAWQKEPKRNRYIIITTPVGDSDAINGDWTPLSNSIEDLVKTLSSTIDYKKAFEMAIIELRHKMGTYYADQLKELIISKCRIGGE